MQVSPLLASPENEQIRADDVLQAHIDFLTSGMMIHTQDEIIAALANDVFNKRQRLIRASQPCIEAIDDRTMKALEAEYRAAESEYLEAKAAFARAMKESRRAG